MKAERWRQIDQLFKTALEQESSGRAAFLRQACGADEGLRREVEAMLEAYQQADGFLTAPAWQVAAAGMAPQLGRSLVGRQFGFYEILSLLGKGGMGEVYLAQDSRLGRKVALKLLPDELVRDPGRLRRLEREARAASALNHPNILTIYEVGQIEGTYFIATEFIEGPTLRQRMASQRLIIREMLEVAVQAAGALAAAHQAGIVHRDIKPENLMLRPDGYVKVLDFGLAKLIEPVTSSEHQTVSDLTTEAGTVLGTVHYMSPEQALGQPVDARTDLFSLGVVLYELASGTRPFEGQSATAIVDAILHKTPVPAQQLSPELPAELDRILEKALGKSREERYQTAADLQADLKRLQRDLESAQLVVQPLPAEHRLASLALARDLEAPELTSSPGPAPLPTPRTPLIGREQELAAVKQLLLSGQARLVTLTGAGGSGKTRLALQVAADLADQFPGGVYFVELASITDPETVLFTVAQVLGVRQTGGKPLAEALAEHVRLAVGSPTLLLLDNFEQVLAAAPLVTKLLDACAALKMLVTSRAVLHVYGEQEYPVLPLAVPDPHHLPPLEELSRNPAVRLFVERAAAANPAFALTADNARAVAEICARLDGLPLAIELAAPRVKMLPPTAMLARLESRLDLLTSRTRDLPARQQALRRTIDWSHGLLSTAEQKLFRRLSVFAGGCTLEGAEAVCDTRGDLEVDLLDGMASLVDKSLLRQVETRQGEPRFLMLETLREYGLERLAASEEVEATRRAHAAYCLVVAEEGNRQSTAAEVEEWLALCDAEHDNFRAALNWLIESENAEWALRLGIALFGFWAAREHLAEGRERLEAIMKLGGASAQTKELVKAAVCAGALAKDQGDFDTAITFLQDALETYRELGDKKGMVVTLNLLGMHKRFQGDWAAARSWLEQSLQASREQGVRAEIAAILSNLADVVNAQGEDVLARSFLEEAMSIFREIGDGIGVAWSFNHLGDVERDRGELAEARRLYQEGANTFQRLGDRQGLARSWVDLGYLACQQDDPAAAHSLLDQALKLSLDLGHKRGIARALEGFAYLAAHQNNAERALTLAGAAAVFRHTMQVPSRPGDQAKLDRVVESARQREDPAAAQAAWVAGWGMRLEQAAQYALDHPQSEPMPSIQS
jgi:predicted ATPase/serine/threonine protein kinase